MKIAFAGQQSRAHHMPGHLHRGSLHEAAVLLDQHFLEIIGVVDEVEAAPARPEMGEVAIARRQGAQEAGRVAAEGHQRQREYHPA